MNPTPPALWEFLSALLVCVIAALFLGVFTYGTVLTISILSHILGALT